MGICYLPGHADTNHLQRVDTKTKSMDNQIASIEGMIDDVAEKRG